MSVYGQYLVAKKEINRDDVITKSSIKIIKGDLEKLPYDVLRDAVFIKNAIAMRHIATEKPITSTMVRRPWAILAGQTVTVLHKVITFKSVMKEKRLTMPLPMKVFVYGSNQGKLLLVKRWKMALYVSPCNTLKITIKGNDKQNKPILNDLLTVLMIARQGKLSCTIS